MSRLAQIEEELSTLTRGEKAEVLRWVARDLGDSFEVFAGIDSDPEVCGGEPCIVRTRIPVWLLVRARQLGSSEADLLQAYPQLRAEDLANAWAYHRGHRDEIEGQIVANEAA